MSGFLCKSCGKDTFQNEYYMIHNELWLLANNGEKGGFLCINCLEEKLQRKLTKKDFTECPVNSAIVGPFSKRSDLLNNRLYNNE